MALVFPTAVNSTFVQSSLTTQGVQERLLASPWVILGRPNSLDICLIATSPKLNSKSAPLSTSKLCSEKQSSHLSDFRLKESYKHVMWFIPTALNELMISVTNWSELIVSYHKRLELFEKSLQPTWIRIDLKTEKLIVRPNIVPKSVCILQGFDSSRKQSNKRVTFAQNMGLASSRICLLTQRIWLLGDDARSLS